MGGGVREEKPMVPERASGKTVGSEISWDGLGPNIRGFTKRLHRHTHFSQSASNLKLELHDECENDRGFGACQPNIYLVLVRSVVATAPTSQSCRLGEALLKGVTGYYFAAITLYVHLFGICVGILQASCGPL